MVIDNGDNGTAGQNGAELPAFAELLQRVGYLDTDLISINHKHPRGVFLATPNVLVSQAPHVAARYAHHLNVWWSVNPLREGIDPGKRGAESDVTRLAALYADLDVADLYPADAKPAALPTLADALEVIDDVSSILGMRPAYVVFSGHGLQPLWPLEAASAVEVDNPRPKAVLKAFGDLVALVITRRFGDAVHADNVYDLARVLRVPGTENVKFNEKTAVTGWPDTGAPMTADYVIEQLATVGIELTDDADLLTGEVVSAPDGWKFYPEGCGYIIKTVENWKTDPEPPDRHGWHFNKDIKVACAWRYGCFRNQAELDAAHAVVDNRLRGWREPSDADELNRNWRDAIKKVSTFSDEKVDAELGVNEQLDLHIHRSEARVKTEHTMPQQASDQAADVEIDEEKFWNGYPELTACRAYARSVRVAPWAMLGAALAIASATTPPHVVLPGIVGDYASVNLYVNLPGKSGAIKSQAIAAARAWLRTTPRVESIKPGSGQGIAKCFAYVKRTKGDGPVQVGKRWTAVAVIPEIDTLTAAGAITSSSLWAEFRSAWSDERVGHDYTDATKTVVLQPRRYRLAMIVGVQPLRAQPLFDDVDAGTPQRFVWFPTYDLAAPDERPELPGTLELPRWPGSETHNFDLDDFWAQRLHEPADRSALTVLKIPPEATEAIDTVAREKLRGNPDIDPLDGHKLLCQLKVAAALMRLCNRREITSKDWELAGVTMAVSDHTRESVRAELSADASRRNLSAAKASGARKVVETRVAADAEVEDIKRISEVIVAALVKAEGGTLTGNKVSKAITSRDKYLVPKALEYLEIDGRIKVEDIEYHGRAGTRIALLDDDEEQTN